WESMVGVWGAEKVLKDTDTFLAGPDFREQMSRYIQRSEVVLVIIGQNWLGGAGDAGHNRLFDEADPVRTEIEEALTHKKVIIPVLINTRHMPESSDLPASIGDLRYQNAFRIHDDATFPGDMRRLNGYFVNPELIALMGTNSVPSDVPIFHPSSGALGRLLLGARTLLCFAVFVAYWLLIGYTTPWLFPPEIVRISGSTHL